jgi:DUF917 family protein
MNGIIKKPKWVLNKESIRSDEQIVFVGEMGVSGVVDGKLPNGDVYEWSKQNRKNKRRLKRPVSSIG